MNIDISTIILTFVNFLLLFAILTYFLFKPVNKVIEDRNNDIKNNINKAEEDRRISQELRSESEKNYKERKKEGRKVVEQYKEKAEKIYKEILQEANKEAEEITNRAKKEINRERKNAESEIKVQAVDLAILLSSKALEKSIDENEHRRLIQDFITKVGI